MRFAGFLICGLVVAATGCSARHAPPASAVNGASRSSIEVSGIWDAMSQTTIDDGAGAGDTRIEKQEWHLTQAGSAITGYYIAALTFVSGDGRPYVCSRQPQFSATQRYDVSGRVRDGLVEIQEMGLELASSAGRCDPGVRQLARYRGRLEGDVMTLVSGGQRRTLYRIRNPLGAEPLLAQASERPERADRADRERRSTEIVAEERQAPPSPPPAGSPAPASTGIPADISGLWVWEHHGVVPGGDEKQEREEWHVTQNGSKLSGYYDRIVHQVSVDGHAYRCSMALDFQITTRYQFNGEVRGNEIRIFESSYEVISPNACDNGKRRLDAYEGQASGDEIRLIWGVGGQVLRRPRPDVPTQRF
jgi:hypothetical protein